MSLATYLLVVAPLLAQPQAAADTTSTLAGATTEVSVGQSAEQSEPAWGKWQAPAQCISAEELLSRVKASFPADAELSQRRVEATARQQAGHWIVEYSVFEDGKYRGGRTLELPEGACRAHDDALVLVFALLLEHGPPEPIEPEEPQVADPEPPQQTEDEPEPVVAPPAEPLPLAPRWGIDLTMWSAFGWTPQAAVGPGLWLRARVFDFLWIQLGGGYAFSRGFDINGGSVVPSLGGELRSQAGLFDLGLCAEWELQWFHPGGCVSGGMIALRAGGQGIEGAATQSALLGHGGLDGLARFDLYGPLQASVIGKIAYAPARAEVAVRNAADPLQVYETNQIIGSLRVGLGLTF